MHAAAVAQVFKRQPSPLSPRGSDGRRQLRALSPDDNHSLHNAIKAHAHAHTREGKHPCFCLTFSLLKLTQAGSSLFLLLSCVCAAHVHRHTHSQVPPKAAHCFSPFPHVCHPTHTYAGVIERQQWAPWPGERGMRGKRDRWRDTTRWCCLVSLYLFATACALPALVSSANCLCSCQTPVELLG